MRTTPGARAFQPNEFRDPGGEAAQRINLGKCYEMKALMREAMAEFKYALEVAKRTQPPNKVGTHQLTAFFCSVGQGSWDKSIRVRVRVLVYLVCGGIFFDLP